MYAVEIFRFKGAEDISEPNIFLASPLRKKRNGEKEKEEISR